MPSASDVRSRLRFDVERLRDGSYRLERIDASLTALRRHLEARARILAKEGAGHDRPGEDGLRFAQAHATAVLARRAALKEVLSGSGLSLIFTMAVSRWLATLRRLNAAPHGERRVRAQVEAGRIAYQMLVSLRRKRGLRSGLGQLTASVVVAEFAHGDDRAFVDEQIEEGLFRARSAARVEGVEDALSSVSLALREAAALLERMAEDAEPAVAHLLEAADDVEQSVERLLRQQR